MWTHAAVSETFLSTRTHTSKSEDDDAAGAAVGVVLMVLLHNPH